jgi:signal recognition particle receptor subunit alpha
MALQIAKAELSYMSEVMARTQPESPRRRLPTVMSFPDSPGVGTHLVTARDNDFDVVLIDTAGRMQDNEVCAYLFRDSPSVTHIVAQPLMRALAKLVSVNHPDRVFFVGEALVGNEAVDQLSKFDRALRDFSGIGGVSRGRGIDGMIVTKWDTVDDKVSSPLFYASHRHR